MGHRTHSWPTLCALRNDGRVEFTKGHGTGNDFVIIADPDGALELTPDLVAALCDRHRGIGADGVLRVVRSAKHPDATGFAAEAEWFMDYWNADGSAAEMCGNGVRVYTRYLLVNGLVTPSAAGLPIATRAGVVRAVADADTIAVHMTTPRVYAAGTASLGALTVPGVAVDCGNPHLVCGVSAPLDELDLLRAPDVDESLFPSGVNVEFVAPADRVDGADLHVRMRVHERGSGETLSCGSGALAVGAVALRDAGLPSGRVAVDLPGGRLTVTATESGEWWLTGPAVLVATGEVDLAAL
jgi:diaminopimelate epimerase